MKMEIVKLPQIYMDPVRSQCLMKLVMWTCGNVLIMHDIDVRCHINIVDAMVTEIVKMFNQ